MTFWEIVRRAPTTKVRLLLSSCLTVWTAYTVLQLRYQPSWEWFTFLAANGGLDVIQHRQNNRPNDDVTATTDIQEKG